MDLVVQKATELGVSAIRPVLCRRTVVKLDAARAERRIAHWRLGQGICKGDRMDLVVQKARRRERNPSGPLPAHGVKLDAARAERRIAHWRAVAVHAAQQSGRTRVPDVGGVEDIDSWLSRPVAGPGIVLSPHAANSVADLPRPGLGSTVRLLVGPEGGLDSREVEHAHDAGFAGLRLGPRVLRTETAALVALSVLQAQWGDLR